PFFLHNPDIEGFKNAITEREKFNTDRQVLCTILKDQYSQSVVDDRLQKNIDLLAHPDSFTICTAHQPNIFTGHLYFIYKIIHVLKIADTLSREIPGKNFIPVFYMGSEDADLEELGHVYIGGQKYEWKTSQTGAVGRMKVDEHLIQLIDEMSGQLTIYPFGATLIDVLKKYFIKDIPLQQAMFNLINHLFGAQGLVVLLPDHPGFKKAMTIVFADDLLNKIPSEIVSVSAEKLSEHYKVQAHPRDINLFYLKDNIRNRIIEQKGIYKVQDTPITFSEKEILEELDAHPERFSPNVILRGLFQEMILPNLAFVGGGGELAYWLELKDLFLHYHVPFPVLVLRNSFMLVNHKMRSLISGLQISTSGIFKDEYELIKQMVRQNSTHQLTLQDQRVKATELYQSAKTAVKEIDNTLEQHVDALQLRTLKTIDTLEKKMLKAEIKKFEIQQRQIRKIKELLFPMGDLQERVENFMPYYAKWGSEFLKMIYDNSLFLDQQFCVIDTDE
ncbi:MAG: bacillithiol biosynthesis cysteine-adding enzyme BshC, partial [Ginsengibacter sp.]